jgi:hypothetical protein
VAYASARSLNENDGGEDGCRHSGFYSGMGLYSRSSRTLRYVLVCDDCGEEMKELSALEYAPTPVFAAV